MCIIGVFLVLNQCFRATKRNSNDGDFGQLCLVTTATDIDRIENIFGRNVTFAGYAFINHVSYIVYSVFFLKVCSHYAHTFFFFI